MVDIQPGDLILVTKSKQDPLAQLVRDLDGSRWSHCGIALPDGRIANCRAGPATHDVKDQGGVRFDEVQTLVDAGLELWRGRPTLDARVVEGATNFALGFGRDGEKDDDRAKVVQQSHFGFAKLFLVSCALVSRNGAVRNLSEQGRRAIMNASLHAARVLSWTWDRPYFYCSEFVAAAYGQPFTVEDMMPRVRGVDAQAEPRTPGAVADFLARVSDEIGGAEGGAALLRLLAVMGFYQKDYLVRALDTVIAWREFEKEHGGKLPAPDGSPQAEPPEAHQPLPLDALPEALVTPRMLARASWMGKPVLAASPSE